jgi:chitinase
MKLSTRSYLKVLFTSIAIIAASATFVFSANVTLRWDANVPAPEGYRVFAREGSQSYDYADPIWENNLTTCTLSGLTEGTTYHFVVRAFDGNLESADSEEVDFTPSAVDNLDSTISANDTDIDGDGVPDVLDMFPDDPNEWFDNDGDGMGDNQDPDNDNDGMTDVWEIAYGLDPLSNDSDLDADGDGLTNLDEFLADNNPTTAPDNIVPDAPVIDNPIQIDRVGLTPVLVSSMYFDTDHDDHLQSEWQISTESDFSTLVLDEISPIQLTAYTVGEMVLDVDTTYYWRVKFIDARSGASDWSQPATFTTITADSAGDPNYNGIPDVQEVDESVDVNENGIPDALEDNIMSVNTIEGQSIVGVETISDNATLVSVKSLATDMIPDQSVKLGFGLIGFKLYLQNEANTATVKISFSTQVPKDAKLYKYIADKGWEEYTNAVFAPNGKSVLFVLVDGGMGDEDGVENGVIVDPSGIAYVASDTASLSTGGTSSGSSADNSHCFISAGIQDLGRLDSIYYCAAMQMVVTLLIIGIAFTTAVKIKKNK